MKYEALNCGKWYGDARKTYTMAYGSSGAVVVGRRMEEEEKRKVGEHKMGGKVIKKIQNINPS